MFFKSLKRILAVLMCVLIVAAVPLSASAMTVSEMQSEIDRLEKEAADLKADIADLKNQKASKQKIKDALDKQINNLQSQINVCIDRINKVEAEIAASEAKIKEKNAEIEESKTLFKKRIRAIYMSNTGSNIQILLGAENFADFLALSELTRDVSARDKQLIADIIKTIDEIQAEIKKNEERIAEQNAIKKDLDAKQAEIEKQAAEIQGVIKDLSSDQNALQADLNKIERDKDSYLDKIIQQSGGTTGKYDGSAFMWPLPGHYILTSGFGPRWGRHHSGIDISGYGVANAKIVAAASGTVYDTANYCQHNYPSFCGCGGGWGRYVILDNGRGSDGKTYHTVYGHMSRTAVSLGQRVVKGQVIGYVGNTGNSTGAHLHFEVWVNKVRDDPEKYVGTTAK